MVAATEHEQAAADWDSVEGAISDAELTRLALDSDPTVPLDPDAVPLSVYLSQVPAPLPDWYMPQAMARSGNRWRAVVVLAIIGAFVLIEAVGLCSTYGQLWR